jgi:hypothetical protein
VEEARARALFLELRTAGAAQFPFIDVTIADVMRASAPTYGVLFQGNTKAVLDHVTIVAGDNGVMPIDGIAPATIDVTSRTR